MVFVHRHYTFVSSTTSSALWRLPSKKETTATTAAATATTIRFIRQFAWICVWLVVWLGDAKSNFRDRIRRAQLARIIPFGNHVKCGIPCSKTINTYKHLHPASGREAEREREGNMKRYWLHFMYTHFDSVGLLIRFHFDWVNVVVFSVEDIVEGSPRNSLCLSTHTSYLAHIFYRWMDRFRRSGLCFFPSSSSIYVFI